MFRSTPAPLVGYTRATFKHVSCVIYFVADGLPDAVIPSVFAG